MRLLAWECKTESIVHSPPGYTRYCVCVCAHACFCAMEFNHACAPDRCVFMWVCACLGRCADVRSEEEVAVFV